MYDVKSDVNSKIMIIVCVSGGNSNSFRPARHMAMKFDIRVEEQSQSQSILHPEDCIPMF